MKDNFMPEWAITDEQAAEFLPKTGFIADYCKYAMGITDAPLIYHLGSCLSLLSCSCPYVDVELKHKGDHGTQPMVLWIGLVGYSGDRKSTAMDIAKRLLERFRRATAEKAVILMLDGSIEAWHDHLVSHPNVLAFRDELSMLFDMRHKGYLKNLVPWLLELYSGKNMSRMIKGQRTEENDSGEQNIEIERPRVNLIGGVPPKILEEKATPADWASGFLPRFKFFPGRRQRWSFVAGEDTVKEATLANWLLRVPWQTRGLITITGEAAEYFKSWIYKNIELPRSRGFSPLDLDSHHARLQEFGLRVAALYALSRRYVPQKADGGRILVDLQDMKLVCRLLTALRDSSSAFFVSTRIPQMRKDVDVIQAWICSERQDGVTIREIAEHFEQFDYNQVSIYIKKLEEIGHIERAGSVRRSGKGRPSTLFKPTVSVVVPKEAFVSHETFDPPPDSPKPQKRRITLRIEKR